MLDIEDRTYQPDMEQLCEYVGLPVFEQLYAHMRDEYGALCKVEYSGDNVLLGWNAKYKKAGRTLCTVYPRQGHFPMLLVVGNREKQRVEALLPSLSPEFREIYESTAEGMGQRWLLLDLTGPGPLYEDALKIIRIRREKN